MDRAELAGLVRRTFEETWRDFYAWKPSRFRYLADAVAEPLQVLKATCRPPEPGTAARKIHPPSAENASDTTSTFVKVGKRLVISPGGSVPSPIPQVAKVERSVKVPAYTFCISGRENHLILEEIHMPFVPVISDELNISQFDPDGYAAEFASYPAWLEKGRDPDSEYSILQTADNAADIILRETLRRLKQFAGDAKQEDLEIDATRILPLRHAVITSYELERYLPPFPVDPGLDNPKPVLERTWEKPLFVPEDPAEDEENCESNAEVFCPSLACIVHGCRRHGLFSVDVVN